LLPFKFHDSPQSFAAVDLCSGTSRDQWRFWN